MSNSCLASRLSYFLDLSDAEKASIERLESGERKYRRGDCVRAQNAPASELFIVRSGWLYSHIALDGGKRQILRLEFPGDLMGTSSIAFGTASSSLTAVTDCSVCPIERTALHALFTEHSRLASLLFLLGQAERVSLDDRLASLGQTSAKSRIAALLLDILVRHRIMSGDDAGEIDVPLTQEDIGDATGLTSVHVNRMIRQLTREGLISRQRQKMRILDEAGLVSVARYVNRYAAVDTSWLPPAKD